MGVEMINAGKVDKTYEQLANDAMKTVGRQYAHFTGDKVMPCKTYGTYFPPIFNEADKYIAV